MVCNRDERRSRPEALPPAWHGLEGGVRAVWPVDPAAGGTWIAASEHGVTLSLLNLNLEGPSPPSPARPRSRGLLIPELIGRRSIEEIAAALAGRSLGEYAPFRLLAVAPGEAGFWAATFRWDGAALTWAAHPPGRVCLVSSGLGDSRVLPRLGFFRRAVRRDDPDAQDRFHRHAWPGRREISVLMSRGEARTVSVTTVEVRSAGNGEGGRFAVVMDYEPVAVDAAARA